MEVLIVKDIELFPLFFELCQMLHNIVIISYTLTEKSTLNCDGNLVVSHFVDGFKALPYLGSGIKSANVYYLVLTYVIGDKDLSINNIVVPCIKTVRISSSGIWAR